MPRGVPDRERTGLTAGIGRGCTHLGVRGSGEVASTALEPVVLADEVARFRPPQHVLLLEHVLLLARIAENACGGMWPNLRCELGRIHVGTFTGPAGTFRQRTEITKAQRDILRQLKIDALPQIYQPPE